MRKTIILLGMLIALSLSGCGDEGAQMRGSADGTEDDSNLQDGKKQVDAVSDGPVDDEVVDLTDYSSYPKKIWIEEGWISAINKQPNC